MLVGVMIVGGLGVTELAVRELIRAGGRRRPAGELGRWGGWVGQYYTILYYTLLYHTILYYTILLLYYTILLLYYTIREPADVRAFPKRI